MEGHAMTAYIHHADTAIAELAHEATMAIRAICEGRVHLMLAVTEVARVQIRDQCGAFIAESQANRQVGRLKLEEDA
jgi:hypothetical protein